MHIPVLQKEALECLNPKPNENFIDCTIGDGGHGLAILEAIGPNGKLLGIDWDEENIHRLKFKIFGFAEDFFAKGEQIQNAKFKDNLILVCDNFVNLEKIVGKQNFQQVSGILLDLGMSSRHLEESGRGFSFRQDEPLDMRYNKISNLESQISNLTAEEIVNNWPEPQIEKILREYGEERFSRKITGEIAKIRKIKPIKTTFHLAEITKRATPLWYHRQRIHFATRTFQALRIAVNDELSNLERVLPQALKILTPGGRLAIISFHSGEDRIVKNFFRQKEKENLFWRGITPPNQTRPEGDTPPLQGRGSLLKILTKKPVSSSFEEIKNNPRARSAKLRAAIKQIATNNYE